MLSDEYKRQRVEISQILLHRCQQEGDETVAVGPGWDHRARNKLLEHLITGNETWLHLSTQETKRDSMTWKHPSSCHKKVQSPAIGNKSDGHHAPTRQNAQRNDLNVTGGTFFPIQPTVQTLHPQTFIYLGTSSAT
ncbi:histone-lysine N-methyltransferase SETMAR [Plakobranchus ocellatus]|uniref:Histone-lysine N-methyltransferase SETMAR n=1 Tax=Plakobranchus ocellatus TaxID=259542 RepID=A0AAV3Y159_9GAST|nr:histone-lysine N-methyltransferase SETMAR [Plakobranchus ocellatus]